MESATKAITYLQSCQEDSLQKRHLDSTLLSHQVLPNFFLITDTYNEMIDANILSQIEDLPLKNQITEMFTNINESNTFVSYFREDLGRAGTIIWEHVSFRLEEDGTLSVSYDLNTLCRSSEFRNALLEVLDSRQDYWNVMNEILEQIESLEISLASY